MDKDTWIKEIMSLRVSSVSQKDVTKILILFYLIEYRKFNIIINIKDIAKYIYEFYIDNSNISKYNSNSVIRNIYKYNVVDIISVVKFALYEWKNDYPNGCLSFNDDEVFVKICNLDDKLFVTSKMIAKMLYKKVTMQEYCYTPELIELEGMKNYDLNYLNNSRLKNRVLEHINYCCCCDKLDDLYIINISDEINDILNPSNYITVCKEHYKLFLEKFYRFDDKGQIIILKENKLLNDSMHISQKVMKEKKIEAN